MRLPTDRHWMGYLFFMAMLMTGAFRVGAVGGGVPMSSFLWPQEVVEKLATISSHHTKREVLMLEASLDAIAPDVEALLTTLLDCVTILDERAEDFATVFADCERLETKWRQVPRWRQEKE